MKLPLVAAAALVVAAVPGAVAQTAPAPCGIVDILRRHYGQDHCIGQVTEVADQAGINGATVVLQFDIKVACVKEVA